MLLELLTAIVLNGGDVSYDSRGYTQEQIEKGKGAWYGEPGPGSFGHGNPDGPCALELPLVEHSDSSVYDRYYESQAAQQSSPANSFSAGSNS